MSDMRILWLAWEDLYTTQRIQQAARQMNIRLTSYEIFDIAFRVEAGQTRLAAHGEDLLGAYDVLVVRTFHPYISETITMAELFRQAGKLVIDQSLTERPYVASKMHDYHLFSLCGLPIPDSYQYFDARQVEAAALKIGFPCILKGAHGSHGTHVYKVENVESLHHTLWRYPVGELILQEYLPGDEDYRVLVIGERALPALICRRPAAGDFRTNLAVNGTFSSRPLSEYAEFGDLAVQAAQVLGKEFAAVDLRLKNDRPVILEVNRRPDFAGFERATQIDVATAFLGYIQEKYDSQRRER